MLRKYLGSFAKYQLQHLLGGRSYEHWHKDNTSLHTVKLKNTRLAEELEKACKKDGFLTYGDYLAIDQFGENGYHNTHAHNGMTDVPSRWPKGILEICKENNFHSLVEFGSGDGKLGVYTLSFAQKEKYPLNWQGVEILPQLQTKTKKIFAQERIPKSQYNVVSNLKDLHLTQSCLFVFSYSLDNLLPEVLVNTKNTPDRPNALLGISVQNGILSEKILSKEELKSKNLQLDNGILTDEKGYKWDLSAWKLLPMQRLYFPLQVLQILIETIDLLPQGSRILIIDEFRLPESDKQFFHLGFPRDLERFDRDLTDFTDFYNTAGKNLLYFPTFLSSIYDFLKDTGFSEISIDSEYILSQWYNTKKREPFPFPVIIRSHALLTSSKIKPSGKNLFQFTFPCAITMRWPNTT